MTKQITIKTCYVFVLLWIGATIGIIYAANFTYGEYVGVLETGCTNSLTYNFMVCPSKTDFDENGQPYWAKQSDGKTVIYYSETDNGKVAEKHTSYDDSGYKLTGFIFFMALQSVLIIVAYLGLNSHYKWFKLNFKSCEKESPVIESMEEKK